MKTSIKSIAAVIALTALVAGPASAMVPQGELNRDIHSVLGGGSNITATVNGDTVTITGYYADSSDKYKAIQVAKNSAGIDRVINLAFETN